VADPNKPSDIASGILTDVTKRAYETSHTLLRLWRLFMSAEEVGISKWNALVSNHVNRLRAFKKMDVQAIGTERGNLKKAMLEKPKMSWPAFIKAMTFLGYRKLTITITAERPNGTTVEMKETVVLQRPMFGDTPSPQPTPPSVPPETP